MQLKDLSQDSKDDIIHERSKRGPFISLEDFLDRTGSHIHLQEVRILIKAGCFDSIARGTTRPGLMWHALRFFDQKEENKTPTLFSALHKILPTSPLRKGGESEIAPLQKDGVFESFPLKNKGMFESPPLLKGDLGGFFKSPLNSTALPVENRSNRKPAPYPKILMLKHEEETLGFLFSIHPLDRYKDILEHLDYVRARDLKAMVGKQVTTIGWQITSKTVRTKDGQTMKFISFEDQTGIYETVLFPKIYHRYCHMLNATRPYILKGKVEDSFGAITMTVYWIGFLDRNNQKMMISKRSKPSYSE